MSDQAEGYVLYPCDFCKEPVAPFGFAPPPRLGIKVRRPIKACAAQACRDQAEARVQALVDSYDPFARSRARPAPAPAPTAAERGQGSLF